MYVYVLSVSRTRLRLGLAHFQPEGGETNADLERLELNLTRFDVEWPQEDPRPPELQRALELLREQTADWPAPAAVATLVQWDKAAAEVGGISAGPRVTARTAPVGGKTGSMSSSLLPLSSEHWTQQGQVALVAPEHLAEARAKLTDDAAQGALSLQLALAWAQELGVPMLTVPLPRETEFRNE